MRKMFVLLFICFATICSCQKQDSAAEAQLGQRKTDLDAREEALVQREKAVDEREKAVAEREKAVATSRIIQSQRQAPDPAQEQAERERIQEFSAEMRARMADPSQLNSAKAEKDRLTQERLAQRQRAQEQLQSEKQRKSKMFSGAVFPVPEASSPTQSPAVEAASPTPSATP